MKHTQPIEFTDVTITDGFWHTRQKLNAETTIYAVQQRFAETGRFEAYKGHWREGQPHKPYLCLTGDVEKWIESVAYLRRKGLCAELEAVCDEVIDNIERNQLPDGYYNMWLLQTDPTKRWTDRGNHELYAIGHLIEAAVAYFEATGKDKLLRIACRAADHAEEVFIREKSAVFVTPGHEEIELALVRLYHCTGKKKYLELSKFFIDERGHHGEEQKPEQENKIHTFNARVNQTHAPVREQTTAEGHAVRAVYLYSGMADIAYEYEDEALLDACRRIFDNMVNRRMYISGGLGSTYRYEGFTIDYDLPNLSAYTESCAAIGLMMFARRMLCVDPDSKYADIIEKVLYNGFLSSTSLSGNAFFYENPLEIDPCVRNRESSCTTQSHTPITQRVKVFDTSCCPPNITRTVASLGDYLYTYDDDHLYVHQFMDSITEAELDNTRARITQRTLYPNDGVVKISTEGLGKRKLAVRIPAWCNQWTVTAGGNPVDYTVEKGYAIFDASVSELEVSFDMTPYAIECSPHVHENAGRVAIMYGPVVYCAEGVDNGEDMRDLHVDLSKQILVGTSDFCGIPTLTAHGWRRNAEAFGDTLYCRVGCDRKDQDVKLVPYFSFANRGECEMVVWLLP